MIAHAEDSIIMQFLLKKNLEAPDGEIQISNGTPSHGDRAYVG